MSNMLSQIRKNTGATLLSLCNYEYILLIFLFAKFCPYFLRFSDVGH